MAPRNENATDARRAYFADIKHLPVLEREEERLLFERYRAGDTRAGHRLVECNLRLVAKLAGGFGRYRIAFLDLVQEGNIGLLHALRKFDPAFGTKFSSYAAYWIRAYMLRHVLQTWSLVKVATTQEQRKAFFRVTEAQRALATQTGDGSDPAAIASLLGVSTKTVATILARLPGDASLDAPIDDGEGRQTSWLDRFSSDEPSAEDLLAAAFARAAAEDEVDDALRELDRRERLIVESRAMSDEPLTLAEIGERLGCSRERVRQLQTRAHEKLRRRILERRAS